MEPARPLDIDTYFIETAEEKHQATQRFVHNFTMLVATLKAQKEVNKNLLAECERDGRLIF